MRLVASTFNPGEVPRSSATAGAASARCSKLSNTSSRSFEESESRKRSEGAALLPPECQGRSRLLRRRGLSRQRGKRHEEDSITKVVQQIGSRLEGETRLPSAARARERQEPHVGTLQQRADVGDLLHPTEEGRRL